MHPRISKVAQDFWNIRGSFKIGGVIEIGTQASLVRRANGKFVLLDSCGLNESVENEVLALTDGGKNIEAILNLHPFHTVYAKKMHALFPKARLYGTARHLSRFPDLPWEAQRTEDSALHDIFAKDFEFSVPRGVDFISSNENVHFLVGLGFSPCLENHSRGRYLDVHPFSKAVASAGGCRFAELSPDAIAGAREARRRGSGLPRLDRRTRGTLA